MKKTDINPGAGWEYMAGSVWRHSSGARIHLLGVVRLSNLSCHNLNHIDGAMGRLMVRANGGNRKRGLMAWAKMLEYELALRFDEIIKRKGET